MIWQISESEIAMEWIDDSTPGVIEYHKSVNTLLDVAIVRNGQGAYTIAVFGEMFPAVSNILSNVKIEAKAKYRRILQIELNKLQ